MSANPFMKFYPQDWRADEKLRLCSLAARGLWIEMLALMHRSERYGHLLIGGIVPTDAQLAVQVGASPDQVATLLAELETAGVFSRSAGGAIYSRRMTRDEKKAKTARQNGKRGGNPSLGNKRGKSASVKGQDKAPDNGGLNTQKPEAIFQREAKASPAREAEPHEKPSLPRDAVIPDDLKRVMQAAGITRPPSDAALLRQWLREGADLEGHILPVARRLGQRQAEAGQAIHKLKYLNDAVMAEVDAERRQLEHYREVSERYGGGVQ